MVGSKDSSVVAYNVASGQEKWRDDSNVEVGSSFAFSIEDLALSFDDQYLSAAVTNGIVYIWDAALGDLVHSLEAHQPFANDGPPSGAMAVAFSPKSLLLVSAGGDDGTLAFWDPLSGELFGRLGPISVNGYLFPTWSPDNIYFADLRALINDIGAMRFSPDGRYLSVGGRYSGSLYLFGIAAMTARTRTSLRKSLVAYAPADLPGQRWARVGSHCGDACAGAAHGG